MPFSQPFVKEPWQQIANWDTFWKQKIVKSKDIAGLPGAEGKEDQPGMVLNPFTEAGRKALKIRGAHLARTMVPTPVIDIQKGVAALKKQPDYRGRLRPPGVVAADALAGVKLYPVDYAERTVREIGKLNPKQGYIARQIYNEIKTLAIKRETVKKAGGDVTQYDKAIKEKQRQLQGLAKQTGEVGKLRKAIK
jgi:hypothetical protein